ncbi:MAG: DNA repair protein RadC, partial [Dehalococcoidales bacterium]|nr:DNA repair protein RadC [Dehalococcoidales bacterium]
TNDVFSRHRSTYSKKFLSETAFFKEHPAVSITGLYHKNDLFFQMLSHPLGAVNSFYVNSIHKFGSNMIECKLIVNPLRGCRLNHWGTLTYKGRFVIMDFDRDIIKRRNLTTLEKRLMRRGIEDLSNQEIIELLICRNLDKDKRDCRNVVAEIANKYKSLREFVSAPIEELRQIPDLTDQCILSIKIMLEISAKFLREEIIQKPVYTSSQQIFDYLYHSMRDLKKEVFRIVYLNKHNQIIDTEVLFQGTLDEIHIYPREIEESAFKHKASGLIFVHNHPSGNPNPSRNDEKITRDLVFIGKVLQISVLDHLIIGDNKYFSFSEDGLISKYEDDFFNLKLKMDFGKIR